MCPGHASLSRGELFLEGQSSQVADIVNKGSGDINEKTCI